MNSDDKQPAGGFQWNAGGWFGSQIGMTAWILVSAIVLFPTDANVAIITALLFVVPNVIGAWMWTSRRRLRPYKAFQFLVVMAGACSMATVFVIVSNGHWVVMQQYGGAVSAGAMYLLILMLVAGLLLLLHFLQRQNVGPDGR